MIATILAASASGLILCADPRITDGDTFRCDGALKIRLWGIDAPEAHTPQGPASKPVRIGGIEVACYVLDDGRRVIATNGVLDALEMARGGAMIKGMNRLELFAAQNRLNGYVSNDLLERIASPIRFRVVAQCWIGRMDVAGEMVRQGQAVDWPKFSKGYYATGGR